MKAERTPSRPRLLLGLLERMGERLSADVRKPYDVPAHDDEVDFDSPTADLIQQRCEPEKP